MFTTTSVLWSPEGALLLAGWIPWTIALVSAIVLGTAFDIDVRDSSASPVGKWNALSATLLSLTGLVGLCLTLIMGALGSALSGGIGL